MTNDQLRLMHLKIKILRNTQQRWETNIHALTGIRSRVPSKFGIDTCYPSLGCVPSTETSPVQSNPVQSDSRVTDGAQRPSRVQSSPREQLSLHHDDNDNDDDDDNNNNNNNNTHYTIFNLKPV